MGVDLRYKSAVIAMPAGTMPRSTARKPVEQYSLLAAKVARFEARSHAGLNLNLFTNNTWAHDLDQAVVTASTRIEVRGICSYPEERAGEIYDIAVSSLDALDANPTLRDLQERDEDHLPTYRTVRGRRIPVFRQVLGLAHMERRRGTREYTAWAAVDPRLVTDWLGLLAGQRSLYLAIDEFKTGRHRWIRSLSLQTTDPATD